MNSNESSSPGFCEYLVPGFVGRNMILLRTLGIIVGLVLTAAVCSLLSVMPQIVFIWLVVVLFFVIMLFRFTKREFEYTVSMGELTVDVIYGKSRRRTLVSLRIADADRVFPVDDFKDAAIERLGADKVIFASPKKSEFMYCLYTKETGASNSKIALVFSSCKRLNDSIRFYNRACFIERK